LVWDNLCNLFEKCQKFNGGDDDDDDDDEDDQDDAGICMRS
jgi:hypothetical protein